MNLGPLLPVWLLGMPLLLAVVDWIRTPKFDARRTQLRTGAA